MKKTKSLTYGAMTVALTGIVLFFDRVTLGMFMSFLAIPLCVYGSYFSFKDSIPVAIACVVMSIIVSGLISTIFMMVGYCAAGLAYTYSREKKWSNPMLYFAMALPLSIFYFIMVTYFGPAFGLELNQVSSEIARLFGLTNSHIVWAATQLSVILVMFMEIFIIKTGSDIVITLLHRNRK